MSKDSISKKVVKEIKEKDVKMHSKQYFVLLTLLTVLSAVLLTTLTAILARIWLDDVDYISKGELLRLGPSGRNVIIGSFPWALTLITALSIFATFKLYKKLDISYKQSLSVFYSGVIIAIILMFVAVSRLDAHKPFERFSGFDRFQTLKQKIDKNAVGGELISVDNNQLLLRDIKGDEIRIDISDSQVRGVIEIGAPVHIIGDKQEDGSFKAEAVYFKEPGPKKRVKGIYLK